MFKVLLVEDEIDIRNGIKNIFQWNDHGIDIYDDAENGVEALEKITETRPDLILLDIQMPLMTGLELLELLNNNNIHIPTIILSGYDDFSYVQKAMRFGVSNYLLKPCSPEEMLDSIIQVQSQVELHTTTKNQLKKYKNSYESQIPFLKEKYLVQLLEGTITHINDSAARDKYHLNIKDEDTIVILVDIDELWQIDSLPLSDELGLLTYAISNIIDESLLGFSYNFEIFEYNSYIVALINTSNQEVLYNQFFTIQETIRKYFAIDITVGLGRAYPLDNIGSSYQEALNALGSKFWEGSETIYQFQTHDNNTPDIHYYPLNIEQKIIQAVLQPNIDVQILNALIDDFFKTQLNSSSELTKHAALLLAFAIEHNQNYAKQLYSQKGLHDISDLLNSLLTAKDLTTVKNILTTYLIQINHNINATKETSNALINQSINFMQINYMNDLSLQDVADNINISSSYLSTLFKKHCDISFIEYLHRIRINKACLMIKENPWIKASVISKKVGYNDERYFYRVFKKIVGKTPTTYKESLDLI